MVAHKHFSSEKENKFTIFQTVKLVTLKRCEKVGDVGHPKNIRHEKELSDFPQNFHKSTPDLFHKVSTIAR